jgi:CubicO group peptidase (beta-lactamase class C family)
MNRRTFLGTGIGLAASPSLLAALSDRWLEPAAAELQQAVDSGQIEAASLYVGQGDTVFARSFGAAKSADAIFLLASISKPIATAAVMSLFDRGLFRLEDPVRKFIPEFNGEGRERITMRRLFTHVSGLPDQLPENAQLRSRHAPLSEFVTGAIRTPLLFAPGSRYSYSSMAILLATEVARRISGKPISALVDEIVCRPLGMRHSAMGVGHLKFASLMRCQVQKAAPESGAGAANTQSWDWNSPYWRRLGVPWGGAHGSARDVARFLGAFLHPDGKLLRPATARLMVSNQHPSGLRQRGLGFDLGLGPQRTGGGRATFGHTGSTGTLCWADPATDTVCVVLTTLPARAVKPHPRDVASRMIADAIG